MNALQLEKLLNLSIAALEKYLGSQELPLGGAVAQIPTQDAPVMTATEVVERNEKKTRKPRASKVEAPVVDPLIGTTVAPTPTLDLTEEQSSAQMQEVIQAFVMRFQTPSQPDGKPLGFHMARKILNEKFKVARTLDLTHPQRIAFIADLKAEIAKADAKGQA